QGPKLEVMRLGRAGPLPASPASGGGEGSKRGRDVVARRYAPIAPRTRSGAKGNSRRRTPVSVAMALPTAQASTGRPSSPAPVGGLSVEITLTAMLGTSDMRAIW